MRLFDTHCHFETCDAAEIAAMLGRAKAVGVERVVAVGGSAALNEAAIAAASLGCLVACGYDRDQVDCARPPIPSAAPLAAWGEIGLDYHYSPETRRAQTALFAEQLEEARRRNLPVVIHTREAADDTIALLREIPSRGVIHCFTGTPEEARAYLDLGFCISMSGIVTFKAADNVRESALVVPDDRILIETDSPFLAPVPMRGQANEPAFVRHTCEFLAKLRGMAPDDFAELTFANAERMFG
ncbi:MAG: TatD family hydrolase [Kiritimatiellae bacterium]|nr:TatD family hydrolase [Kiritimatiellia bacterium]